MKYTKQEYKRAAFLNAQGFESSDEYSDWKKLRDFIESNTEFTGLLFKRVNHVIVGYLFWSFDGTSLKTNRRAVAEQFQGCGYGVELTRRIIKKANKWGFKYTTYAGNWNLASINSSIKCGCKITKIGKRWTHLEAGKNILD